MAKASARSAKRRPERLASAVSCDMANASFATRSRCFGSDDSKSIGLSLSGALAWSAGVRTASRVRAVAAFRAVATFRVEQRTGRLEEFLRCINSQKSAAGAVARLRDQGARAGCGADART